MMSFFDDKGVEFSQDHKILLKCPTNLIEYAVPYGVESISSNAFKDCSLLTSISLPPTFKKFSHGSLDHCKITKIDFWGSLEEWLNIACDSNIPQGFDLYFSGKLVENIIVPDSITKIRKNAFYYCKSLKSVIFNANLETIEDCAFNKTNIKGILSIPKSCRTIGKHAFFNCTSITKVKIPAITKTIGVGAFSACYNLQEFVVSSDNITFSTDGIGLFQYNSVTLSGHHIEITNLLCLASASQKKYVLPDKVGHISEDCCCFDSIPAKGLTILNHVGFRKKAFRNCSRKVFTTFDNIKEYVSIGLSREILIPIIDINSSRIDRNRSSFSLIVNNPYRILGVYTDATLREIQANANKIKRFLEIGKDAEFPTDLNLLLPKIVRTSELVDKALAQISNPRERLKHSFFWISRPRYPEEFFVEEMLKSGHDKHAMQMIAENNLSGYGVDICYWIAKEFYDKNREGFSFISSTYENYHHHKYDNETLLEKICGSHFSISKEDFYSIYFEGISEELNPLHLWAGVRYYFQDVTEVISKKLYDISVAPIIIRISDEIRKTDDFNKLSINVVVNKIIELYSKTKSDIELLDDFVPSGNIQLINIHDSLAERMLNGCIYCYNNQKEDEYTKKVYSLTQDAEKIAKGDLLKQRIAENLSVIKKAADELAPEGLEHLDKVLIRIIQKYRNNADTFDNASDLLGEVEDNLFKIKERWLKAQVEKKNNVNEIYNYFRKVSTVIASICLNKIIESINNNLNSVNKTDEAIIVLKALEQLPLHDEFKEQRYYKNINILTNNNRSYFNMSSTRHLSYLYLDLRTDEECWKDVAYTEKYEEYLRRFPNGAYVTRAKELQEKKLQEKRAKEAETVRQKRLESQKIQKERAKEAEAEHSQKFESQKIQKESKRLNIVILILSLLIIVQVCYFCLNNDGLIIGVAISMLVVMGYVFVTQK